MDLLLKFCFFLIALQTTFVLALCSKGYIGSDENGQQEHPSPKLLILMIDGFRWDYYERQKMELNAFRQFISEGVQTQWVNPIFPTLSYPNWATVHTGLFPESHGFLGNYMLDRGDENRAETEFNILALGSTFDPKWWKNCEPIWITAMKNNHKVFSANWDICNDIFEGVTLSECTPYKYTDTPTIQLRENLQTALQRLNQDFSLAMVYTGLLDHAGHVFGPDSYNSKIALMSIDSILREFEFNLRISSISNKLNMIILGDHGMTNIEHIVKISLGDYINIKNVYKIVDFGGISSIAAVQTPKAISELHEELQRIPGVDVYSKEEIPEEFHYKNNPLVLDFLLVARAGYSIMGIQEKMLPNYTKASEFPPYSYLGTHGYYNISDMRTIFFARGPAFKKGLLHSPIGIEDEYQILAKILDFTPKPNNGSWDRVTGMFI